MSVNPVAPGREELLLFISSVWVECSIPNSARNEILKGRTVAWSAMSRGWLVALKRCSSEGAAVLKRTVQVCHRQALCESAKESPEIDEIPLGDKLQAELVRGFIWRAQKERAREEDFILKPCMRKGFFFLSFFPFFFLKRGL